MAQFGLSAAQHSLSPISPAAGPASSSSVGPAVPPPPASTASGGGGGGSVAGSSAAQQQHKRVYQACIPCRRRKVRCDLGSVDDPHDPPCVRCRRESKECYFSATRRKRKNEDDSIDLEPEERDHDDYILRNGRKSMRTTSETPTVTAFDRRLYSEVPLTPGGSQGRPQPLRRPEDAPKSAGRGDGDRNGVGGDGGEFGSGEGNTPLENFEARSVMRREVYGPHDALDLLYKAATDENPHQHSETQHRPAPSGGASQSAPFHARQESAARHPLHPREREPYGTRQAPPRDGTTDPAIDPELIKRESEVDPGREEALKAWARFRFVRAGWFTAQEAIDYITYYYDYLSPLTPISPPTFRSHASHLTLLTEEPILAVTLLTIASRYRKLPGTGGTCRAHAIHEQLWTYLRGMIERVVWGQEAFGGGFCGSGAADEAQSSTTAPWRGLRRGSLRTFGTIESLMILTEWHPRALHFPPNEAIDELLLPSYDQSPIDDEAQLRQSTGVGGGRRIDSWLEPAWRSDRMCWMLLSTAMGLAYELGVFDDIDSLLATGAITRPEYEEESYRLRAYRIKRLLLIYLSQLAGRLGWTNMVPQHLRDSDPVVRKRPHSVEGATPGTNPSSLSNGFNYIPDLELDDQIIHCWAGISNAMHMGNERLFQNRKHTTDIIQSGKYITMLKEFQPMLKNWWKEFERFPMPPFIKHILTIEYEYVRIYVNSLSLQAVVERCTNNAGGGGSVAGGSVSGHSAPQLSPQTQHYYGKLPLGQLGGFGAEDQEYVREVVNGSRNLLRTVVEGLLPGDYLKHVPVRTYFRIISGAMFLLKTFALGAPKSDVELSIGLMDRTVDALRNCVVDDVHLGIRFADMLETLTSRLRNRFIYAPPVADAMSTSPNHHHHHHHADAANGHANGNGGHLGSDPWLKLKEGGHTLERSSTPANISATPWDMTSGTFPYPTGSASMFGPSTPAAVPAGLHDHNNDGGGTGLYDNNADWSAPGTEMWYLPPGAAFFSNMGDANVSMTAEGVNVGGIDLLDFMVMDGEQGPFGMDGHPGF